MRELLKRSLALVRSMLAGGVATIVDMSTLALLVSALGVPARVASVAALLLGGAANFLGNRHFAFRATSGSAGRQAVLYSLVFAVTLASSALLFDLALRAGLGPYWLVRLVVSNVVYLGWSFPMFRWVFAAPRTS